MAIWMSDENQEIHLAVIWTMIFEGGSRSELHGFMRSRKLGDFQDLKDWYRDTVDIRGYSRILQITSFNG